MHAPYTVQTTLMTGTMHFDSRDIAAVPRQSLFELKHARITNEGPADGTLDRLSRIEALWSKDQSSHVWPPKTELKKFKADIRVSYFQTIGIATNNDTGFAERADFLLQMFERVYLESLPLSSTRRLYQVPPSRSGLQRSPALVIKSMKHEHGGRVWPAGCCSTGL